MGKRIPPSPAEAGLEQEVFSGMVTGGDPLGEAARRGAQLLLQKALEMEVSDFLGRGHYEHVGDATVSGYRNGYDTKRVHMAEGTIELQVLQLRETLEPFASIWLQAIAKRSKKLLARLFGEGRRRTKVIPRFTSESSGMSLVFAVLVDASEGWRGVRMRPYLEDRLKQMLVDPESEWEDPELKKLVA